MRIYLIGLPGVGKSELGKRLAQALDYQFIDLDSEIEKDSLMFIDDIFARYGELTFRNQESKMLEKINIDNVVISTGGGIVLRKENKEKMNGKIIYLYDKIENIKERMNYERPLLREKTLEEIYNERKELYDYFADYKIENANIDECLKGILKVI